MRHQSKKIKIQKGYDANKMLVRKLTVNFLRSGKITTTEKKAKVLKPVLERLTEKSRTRTESNKNFLLKSLANPKLVEVLFSNIGPAVKEISGGYVKTEKLYKRESDGALMVRLMWSIPVVLAPFTNEKLKAVKDQGKINKSASEKNEKLK